MLMNEHVYCYYRLLCLKAEFEKRFFEQFFYYTLSMRERDINWRHHH